MKVKIKTYYPDLLKKYLSELQELNGVKIYIVDTSIERVSLGRSPHGHKTSSDQFCRKTYKYIIDLSSVKLSKEVLVRIKYASRKFGTSICTSICQ